MVAAALVRQVYDWNAFCEWRETRNLVAGILQQLRPLTAKRLLVSEQSRAELLERLDRLRANPLYVRRVIPDEPCYQEREIESFAATVSAHEPSLPAECIRFSIWLRGQSDYRIGNGAQVNGEIPGIAGFASAGMRHPHENEASTLFTLLLIELLSMAYGSNQFALNDAHLIMTRAFANAPHAVLDYEVMKRTRWRKRQDVPAAAHELGRFGMWQTLAEIAETLQRADV